MAAAERYHCVCTLVSEQRTNSTGTGTTQRRQAIAPQPPARCRPRRPVRQPTNGPEKKKKKKQIRRKAAPNRHQSGTNEDDDAVENGSKPIHCINRFCSSMILVTGTFRCKAAERKKNERRKAIVPCGWGLRPRLVAPVRCATLPARAPILFVCCLLRSDRHMCAAQWDSGTVGWDSLSRPAARPLAARR